MNSTKKVTRKTSRVRVFISAVATATAFLLVSASSAQAWVWVPNFKGSPGGDWGTGQYVAEPGDTGAAPTIEPMYSWRCNGTWTNGNFIVGPGPDVVSGGLSTVYFPNDHSGNAYRNQAQASGTMGQCDFSYSERVPQSDNTCGAFSQFSGPIGERFVARGTPGVACIDYVETCKRIGYSGWESVEGVKYRTPTGEVTMNMLSYSKGGSCFTDTVTPDPDPTPTPNPTPTITVVPPVTPPAPPVPSVPYLTPVESTRAASAVKLTKKGKGKVVAKVSYSPRTSGAQKFKLYKKSGGKWKTVKTVTKSTSGSTVKAKFSTNKNSVYRVCVVATSRATGGCSSAVRSR